MRITIEMTEAEGRSTTIHRPRGGELPGEHAPPQEAPPLDGGPPPEGLLLALGARTGVAAGGPTESLGSDAGGPPAWLVGVLGGGADQPRA